MGGTARLIQIPIRISVPLGDRSLTGSFTMFFNMLKFHTAMFSKVQGRGMFTFSKICSELHLKPEQRVLVFKDTNFKTLTPDKL